VHACRTGVDDQRLDGIGNDVVADRAGCIGGNCGFAVDREVQRQARRERADGCRAVREDLDVALRACVRLLDGPRSHHS
jgi:hypothetical protein